MLLFYESIFFKMKDKKRLTGSVYCYKIVRFFLEVLQVMKKYEAAQLCSTLIIIINIC